MKRSCQHGATVRRGKKRGRVPANRAATHKSRLLYSTTTYSHSHAVGTALQQPMQVLPQLTNHQINITASESTRRT